MHKKGKYLEENTFEDILPERVALKNILSGLTDSYEYTFITGFSGDYCAVLEGNLTQQPDHLLLTAEKTDGLA